MTRISANLNDRAGWLEDGVGNFEIGRILLSNPKFQNLQLDRPIGDFGLYRISDLRCRIRPISKFDNSSQSRHLHITIGEQEESTVRGTL